MMTSVEYQLAKAALFQAVKALEVHRDSVILVGAQAIYAHTSNLSIPVQPFTNDADFVLDASSLALHPGIDTQMRAAGFLPNPSADAVGSWINAEGVPVDLMVPVSHGGRGRRAARLPNHGDHSIRKTRGLEAVLFDNSKHIVPDPRADGEESYEISIAGPAALLIAKLTKLGERVGSDRILQKDAHDIYRLLFACDLQTIAGKFIELGNEPRVQDDLSAAVDILRQHFASSPQSLGSKLAGDTERMVGDPLLVSNRTWALSNELLESLDA